MNNMTWIVEVKSVPGTEDLYIDLPLELLEAAGLAVGDVLSIDDGPGTSSIILSKVSDKC